MANISRNVLKMLGETAGKEVDLATEALAKAMKNASEAQSKYDLLTQYRQDYLSNLSKTLESGMNAEAHQNFHHFMAKLDQALAGQKDVLVSAQYQVTVQKQLWQACQRKKLSYEVLTTRSDKKMHQIATKKSQKETDEFAMRANHKK